MSTARAAQLEYRRAFEDFARIVAHVQALAAQHNSNRNAVETALVELERARELYNQARDAWVQHLLPASARNVLPAPMQATPAAYADDVRTIAELIWESTGRPEGTAAEDWRVAEEIVKRAKATAA